MVNRMVPMAFVVVGVLVVGVLHAPIHPVPKYAYESLWAVEWADSVYAELSTRERIGQLLMVRAYSKGDAEHERQLMRYVRDYGIGGVCFFQGDPVRQVRLVNRLQGRARIPLLVAIDAEWGLGMRFPRKAISFPRALMLGAIEDNRLIYEMAREIARQLRLVGVQVNFAPVVDVNNNPANPVIHDRSFGEDIINVTAKGYAYMRGLQDGGVMDCLKHFPGHGDTDVDSHLDLPVIRHTRGRLDSVELFPFRVLMNHGARSVMVAHLNVPALGTKQGYSTTLTKEVVTGLLKERLGFGGLIFTDALDMKGVSKYHPPGKIERLAFEAGNDVLVLPQDVGRAIDSIEAALRAGRISESRLRESVVKILRWKYAFFQGKRPQPLPDSGLLKAINTPEARALKWKLITASLTLVRDDERILDSLLRPQVRVAVVSFGRRKKSIFHRRLEKMLGARTLYVGKDITPSQLKVLRRQLQSYPYVVISLHGVKKYKQQDYGISTAVRRAIAAIDGHHKVVLVNFGTPYALSFFDSVGTVVQAYWDDGDVHDIAAQAIAGAMPLKGRLPVTASGRSAYGSGIRRRGDYRLGYAFPEYVDMWSDSFWRVDSIMRYMVEDKIAPGGVVLVARRGKVVFHKAYGYHTYQKIRRVKKDDVFDLASVTKVAAATIALMKLWEEGKWHLDTPLRRYFPEWDTTNKADLHFREILAHHGRLIPWIPFYKSTLEQSPKGSWVPSPVYYRSQRSEEYPYKVCQGMYLCKWYPDSIWWRIGISPLREQEGYRYSDLGFYMAGELVRRLSGQRLDSFVERVFYRPMGLRDIGYNPLQRGIPTRRILPTEEDHYFRYQKLSGYVHDMGAAMLGGVSGHAGLFSDADDLAAVFQMLLNGGQYRGVQFLRPETIDTFTTRYKASTRRGLGFDMKELNDSLPLNVAAEMSERAFGHYGFTGTCVWADPEYDLIIVILSNRTYPTMTNRRMYEEHIRQRVQSAVYRAMKDLRR